MNVNISIDSEILKRKTLEALSTAVFYRNTLASASGGYDLLNEPQYRELLMQLQEHKTPSIASPTPQGGSSSTIQTGGEQVSGADRIAQTGGISLAVQSSNATHVVQADSLSDSIFRQLQNAIDDGTYREQFPVGTILPDTWTDTDSGIIYDMPLRIVDYREVTLANGKSTVGAILLRVNASPNSITFASATSIYSRSYARAYLNAAYRDGCSAELLDVIVATSQESIYEGEKDVSQGWMFLPTPEELHVNLEEHSDAEVDDLLAWEYFRDTPTNPIEDCEKRGFRDPNGSAQSVWLRSRYNSRFVRYMGPTGLVGLDDPSYDRGVLAACIIVGRKVQQDQPSYFSVHK